MMTLVAVTYLHKEPELVIQGTKCPRFSVGCIAWSFLRQGHRLDSQETYIAINCMALDKASANLL